MKAGIDLDRSIRSKTGSPSKKNPTVEELRQDIRGLDKWFEHLQEPLSATQNSLPNHKGPKPKKTKKRKIAKKSFIKVSSSEFSNAIGKSSVDRKILSLKLGNGIELEFWQ